MAIAGRDSVIILSACNEIWKYKVYDDSWQKVTPFIPSNDDLQTEYAIKMSQAGCTVVLTNLGKWKVTRMYADLVFLHKQAFALSVASSTFSTKIIFYFSRTRLQRPNISWDAEESQVCWHRQWLWPHYFTGRERRRLLDGNGNVCNVLLHCHAQIINKLSEILCDF